MHCIIKPRLPGNKAPPIVANSGDSPPSPSKKGKPVKKSLIALTLIAITCSACSKQEEPAVVLPPPVSTPSLNANDAPPPAPQAAAPETPLPGAPAETAPAASADNK